MGAPGPAWCSAGPAQVHQGRGLTQAELGKAVGVSRRLIAYYETESQQPPGAAR
jgi:DNA-binding transcriptional regulator YiaG